MDVNAIFAMVFDNELGTESENIGEGNQVINDEKDGKSNLN